MNSIHDNLYDRKAEEYNWRGPEIIFGLAYPYTNQGESLLDMGIGTGLSSEPFAGAGLKVYGMDISEKMLDICRDKGFTWGLQNKQGLGVCPCRYLRMKSWTTFSKKCSRTSCDTKGIPRSSATSFAKAAGFGSCCAVDCHLGSFQVSI